MKPRAASPTAIIVVYALWMALAGNAPLWRKLDELGLLRTSGGVTLAAGMAAIVFGSLVMILGAFGWRGTLKPVATALLLVTAVCGHFMLAYGVVIDPAMVVSAVETDVDEALALVTGRLLATVIGLAVLPAWLLWRWPVAYGGPYRQLGRNVLTMALGLALCVAAAVAGFQGVASAMRNHKELRYLVNPLAAVYAAGRVATRSVARGEAVVQRIGDDAVLANAAGERHRPRILLLVLGETARSGNFAINGYSRPTTPELEREDVASFRNAWACGTSTAESLPCMFSDLGRERFARDAPKREGLLDVLQRAGLAVLWIDNQTGCKGVCDRVPSASTVGITSSPLCASGPCLDGVMLEGLDQRIAALDQARVTRGLVVVLHQMGSHGPAYYQRSPPGSKPFQPECATASLHECDREALVNAYDNSIVYTDHFLAQAIGWLKARSDRADTALVYVADHGESLGENHLYLHGLPYVMAPDVQKRVPWITWLSDGFRRSSGVSLGCLRAARDERISHDHYFHSIVGLMDVRTRAYDGALDVYANCRGELVARARGVESAR